jgi:hypothetical protein
MTAADAIGLFAAFLVLSTFWMQRMVALRVTAIASNLAFFAYGFLMDLYPILLLHALLLPLNLHRLNQLRAGFTGGSGKVDALPPKVVIEKAATVQNCAG